MEACCALSNREELVEAASVKIERDFELVGSTAIEDKLQEDVGLTIKKMKEAGIRVWVLTGDKVETAINIGYSCELLNNDMTQAIINGKTSREVLE